MHHRIARRVAGVGLGLVLGAALIGARAVARGAAGEEEAVRGVLQEYFAGQATGDGSHFARIFHPNANLYWIRDGKYAERTSRDWIAAASGKPQPDDAQRRRRIAQVDVAGNAAQAKLVTEAPNARVTDYMSLLKVDGEWKIVAKTFVFEPRTP